VLLLLLLCSVCCCVNDTSRAKKKRTTSVSSSRSRHEDDYFFFWCVRTWEFGKPSIGPSDGSDSFKGKIRGEKKFFLCFGRWYFFTSTAQLAFPHTHTRSNLFKRYGYEFFCFWRGKHGGTRFYRRTRAFRFASRSSFEAAIPRVFAFFLFPSAAKVIFLPPPLVAGGGTLRDFSERCEGEFERRTRKGHRGILLGRELRVESLLRRCFRALFVRYPTR